MGVGFDGRTRFSRTAHCSESGPAVLSWDSVKPESSETVSQSPLPELREVLENPVGFTKTHFHSIQLLGKAARVSHPDHF